MTYRQFLIILTEAGKRQHAASYANMAAASIHDGIDDETAAYLRAHKYETERALDEEIPQ